MPAAARDQPVRTTYSVEILPDDADEKMGDPVFTRLLCAADRILGNPAFDPADGEFRSEAQQAGAPLPEGERGMRVGR